MDQSNFYVCLYSLDFVAARWMVVFYTVSCRSNTKLSNAVTAIVGGRGSLLFLKIKFIGFDLYKKKIMRTFQKRKAISNGTV